MARPIRIEYNDAWYHVTCRGNDRQVIFKDDEDRRRLLLQLAENLKLYRVELHAYVLMSNHFHLLIKTTRPNLRGFMQRFNTSYTVYFNIKHKRTGHVYQGRYKAILIDADAYLLELSRYVHLNPVRIKKNSALSIEEKRKILDEYAWSSYRGYVQESRQEAFVSHGMILETLTGRADTKARKQYRQFVTDGIMKDMNITFWDDVRGQAVKGREGFIDEIYTRYLRKRKQDKREQSGLDDLKGRSITRERIAAVVAQRYGVSPESLYIRRSQHREARAVMIELYRRYLTRDKSLSSLGRELGEISVAAISLNCKRLAEKIVKDKTLKKVVEEIENQL